MPVLKHTEAVGGGPGFINVAEMRSSCPGMETECRVFHVTQHRVGAGRQASCRKRPPWAPACDIQTAGVCRQVTEIALIRSYTEWHHPSLNMTFQDFSIFHDLGLWFSSWERCILFTENFSWWQLFIIWNFWWLVLNFYYFLFKRVGHVIWSTKLVSWNLK